MPEPDSSLTLSEAARLYLSSVPSKQQSAAQVEVGHFVRWYGNGRTLKELTPPQVAGYAQYAVEEGGDVEAKLAPVRTFLAYLRREKLLLTALASHLRVQKARRAATNAKGPAPQVEHLTVEGKAQLEAELDALRKERPRVAAELRRAMADKDFRENSPLDAIRDHQGHLEARIRQLEATLAAAEVLPESQPSEVLRAQLGLVVTLLDLETDERMTYTLVSPSEASPSQGKISLASPVGKAIQGRAVGEEAEVVAPARRLRYRIVNIQR